MKKLYIFGLMLAGLASCKPNIEPDKPGNGNVDVSRYLAVGNSLTAGYMDGSLYREGQLNSFPAILAKQFRQVQYGEFKQPLLKGEFGYPVPKLILKSTLGYCDKEYSVKPVRFPGALDSAGASASLSYDEPFNNVGVPGIRVIDFPVKAYGLFNPYAKRFFTSPELVRPIDEAMRLGHTFFTLWAGNNDVLGYAIDGGEESSTPISETDAFTVAFDTIISNLTKYESKGVVINIPDITAIPYFTTIPAKGLMLNRFGADTLNDDYNGTGMRFTEGYNYFVIEDQSMPNKRRQIKEGEYVLLSLPMDSVKCAAWGSRTPIPARFVLTADEVAKVKEATTKFNSIMANAAAKHNLLLLDMYSYMATLVSGIKFNGVTFNAEFISGGAFSLDGIHLTPRGNAIVANKVITLLNENYGASIPYADVNSYRGNLLP